MVDYMMFWFARILVDLLMFLGIMTGVGLIIVGIWLAEGRK